MFTGSSQIPLHADFYLPKPFSSSFPSHGREEYEKLEMQIVVCVARTTEFDLGAGRGAAAVVFCFLFSV